VQRSTQTEDPLLVTLTRSALAEIIGEALADFVPPAPEPQILTQAQAAELLQVSTRTVRTLVAEHGLPEHRVGDSPRYLRSELIELVRRNGGAG
jgi:excisionase family DNA binding protein